MNTNITRLLAAIKEKDVSLVLSLVDLLTKESLTDTEVISWVTDPANISLLHNMLNEYLDIPHRIMQLRFRIPNKRKRAYFFFQSIKLAIEKAYKDE